MDNENLLSKAPYGAVVYQASGMVSVQATCTVNEALGMMKERALVNGETLERVAQAVLSRELRFG
ncbi:MAG: hypothetical protein ACLPVY_22290 [Acidimicrobiia bacterium]